MTADTHYVLDANVFIEAKRRYYAFDICPGFWESLVWHYGAGHVSSIDRIKQELEQGKDDLADWVSETMPDECFASTDEDDTVEWFGRAVAWVQQEVQFSSEAKAEFAQKADAWLIAHAKAKNRTIVTHEVEARDARRKVPIPNVCVEFGVTFVDSFEMLRVLEARFEWTRPA